MDMGEECLDGSVNANVNDSVKGDGKQASYGDEEKGRTDLSAEPFQFSVSGNMVARVTPL